MTYTHRPLHNVSFQICLELLLSCQICLEEFEENGDHVARILPCSHTVCEKCLKQLIRGNNIECPECREKHKVKNFPQNKYLLPIVRKFINQKQDDSLKPGNCKVHGKELNLYCKELSEVSLFHMPDQKPLWTQSLRNRRRN